MEIKIFDSKEDLNHSFTVLLKEILEGKEQISIALSGGSTPKSLFDYWAKNHPHDIDWHRVKIFWGDERCVSPDDEESNYRMTKIHLLDHIPIPEENIFRIQGERNPQDEAERYATILQKEVQTRNYLPAFDLIILGMGDDGHTASIFPQEMGLWHSRKLCVVATHPQTGQKRVSLSGTVINAAQCIAFLVTGENKAAKIKEIIVNQQASAKKYPAALVQPDSGKLFWFVDKKAAKLL